MTDSSLSKALGDLASAPSMIEAAEIIVFHIEHHFPADRVCINWLDSEGSPTRYWGAGTELRAVGQLHPVLRDLFDQHPAQAHASFASRFDGAWRISGMVSQRRFRELPLYVDYYRHLETRDQCGFQLDWNWNESIQLVLSRGGKPFDQTFQNDLEVAMRAFRPVYALLNRQAQLLSKVDLLESLVSEGQVGFVRFCGKTKEIRRNRAAARLMEKAWNLSAEQWLATIRTSLPEATSRRVQAYCERLNGLSECPLRVIDLPGMEETDFTLILKEGHPDSGPKRHLSNLTRRETEVLHWITAGKTNSDVAAILGLSVRTIEKHCEHIFTKLGVESRLAAARVMLDSV